jgi:hypothetical protein
MKVSTLKLNLKVMAQGFFQISVNIECANFGHYLIKRLMKASGEKRFFSRGLTSGHCKHSFCK